MSLPHGMEASTAEQKEAGRKGPRGGGQGLNRGSRPGRIFRRVAPVLKGTSAPGSEAMRDPGISGEWGDMVAAGVVPPGAALTGAVVAGKPREAPGANWRISKS